MNLVSTESGAQLLARVSASNRPALKKLCPEVLPHSGPNRGEMIEISGESNVGKSMLLLEFMAKAIIPVNHGGKGANVYFIDLSGNFHIFTLRTMLEKHILHHKMIVSVSVDTEDVVIDDVQSIIEKSMENLILFKCFSGDELERILVDIEYTIAENVEVSMLAIDSLGTYYWLDIDQIHYIRMDTYLGKLLKCIKKIVSTNGLVLAYTRPSYFPAASRSEAGPQAEYLINLTSTDNEFNATTLFNGERVTKRYCCDNFGIRWKYEEPNI